MIYISEVQWDNNNIEHLIFGYTEKQYIKKTHDNKVEIGIIFCWKSHVSYNEIFNYTDKKFDPLVEKWLVKKSSLHNNFQEALKDFFEKLFN